MIPHFSSRVLRSMALAFVAGSLLVTRSMAAGCDPAPAGLIGWWGGDGNANTLFGTNNGTLQGSATATGVGFVDQCFSFNGSTAFVQIPDAPILRPTNLTVEAWVRFTSLNSTGSSSAGQQYIVFKQNSRNNNFEGFYLGKQRGASSDSFVFTVSSAAGAVSEVVSTLPIAINTWYHVAGVRGSNFVQLFVNGVSAGTASVSFPQDYGNFPLYLGTSGQSFWDHKLSGLLDEVSLYNRALSSNEIADIYAAGSAGKCKGAQPPLITVPPQNQTVAVGSNANFAVTATGAAPLAYQWLFNTAIIPGATSSNLALVGVQTNNGGNYQVVVTNASGAATSSVAVLTVLIPPAITADPQNQTNVAGTTAIFTGTASGSPTLTYQWRLNGTNLTNGGRISGATTTSLTITSVQASDAGNYTLTASNTVGNATSAPASLTVNGPPVITAPPQSLTVAVGSNASFAVSATGTAPLGYQWLFNTVAIPGATNSGLTLLGVQTTDGGNYQVVVSNVVNSVTSAVAVLTVLTPPGITSQPQSQTNITGTTAIFSAGVSGSPTLNFQWRLNGSNLVNGGRISGATATTLTITGVQAGDAGNYTLFVSNTVGNVTSAPASLTVNGPPVITVPPQNQTVTVGSNANFAVTATGTAPLSFQWQFNSVDISGATSNSLFLTNAQTTNAGNYRVVVTNVAGSATSSVAVLNVLTPPGITSQPQSLTNITGTTAIFSAGVSGSPTLNFQWRLNGSNLANGGRISGATTATLTITGVLAADAGNYTLFVTNAVGNATAGPATLTVNSPPAITGQPGNQSVLAGVNVSFNVTATGTPAPSYRWLRNGLLLTDGGNVSGSATPGLALSNVQTNDAAGYQVIVTNIAGAATSSVATLTVNVQGGCQPAPNGLIGWWTGDGNALDSVNADNGTLQGGATASALGLVSQGFTLNGSTAFVQIPDAPILRPTNLTVEAWVLFTSLNSTGNSLAGQQYIVFRQNTRVNNFEGFYLAKERGASSDNFVFTVTSAAGQSADVTSTLPIAVNTWYHVAGVRGSNYIQLFVNGVSAGTSPVSFPQDYGNFPLYFGTSGQSYWDHKLSGMLDEVSLYNRALTAGEVAAIYAAGSGGKCKGAVGPTIVTQPANKILSVGGSVTFSVSAVGSAPLSYQWFKDTFKLNNGGNISGATSTSLTVSNLSASDLGNYQVVVTNFVGSVTSVVASLSTGIPPSNDNFASAQTISGSSGTVTGNNANATKQSGEPNHAGNAGGPSVWYNWTAPSTSPVTFDTALTSFDTLLAVYTGNSVGALTPVASNNDISSNNVRSRLTFTPVSGTVYRIAVDGANGANGNLTLRWAQASVALPNLSLVASAVNPHVTTETFAQSSCAVQEGLIQAGTRTLIRFDTETENSGNADLVFGNPANNPQFVFAPCHAHYHFQNYMSYRLRNSNGQLVSIGLKVGFCVLDVFRWQPGSANNAKYTCTNQGIQVGWGDLYDNTLDGQWIDITGLPAGNYTMELEANPQGIIQESNYSDNLSIVPITIGNPNSPPANDNFASSQTLLGGFASVSGNSANATKEAGEPNHAGDAGGHSVWYSWTAVETKAVTIDTIGSSFNTLLAVYTGNSVGALNPLVSNDDIAPGNTQSRVTFNATAGTVYRIAVDGAGGASGNLILTLNQTIQNDNFANCQFVGGVNGVAYGSDSGGTKEVGEPNHAGNAGGHSIWYCWTAPIGGSVTFDTTGSSFNTLLAVYTGTSVTGLTPVASNDDIDPANTNLASRVSFNAVGLTMYHIAIDGFNGDTGDSTLNWNLIAIGGGAQGLSQDIAAISQAGGAKVTSAFLPEGEFQLNINGKPSQLYQIQISCDLVHWAPSVTTLSDDSGKAHFVDKVTMNAAMLSSAGDPVCGPGNVQGATTAQRIGRFYRAVPVPQSH